jgi:hypothetical protein
MKTKLRVIIHPILFHFPAEVFLRARGPLSTIIALILGKQGVEHHPVEDPVSREVDHHTEDAQDELVAAEPAYVLEQGIV